MKTQPLSHILQKKFIGADDFRRYLTDILNKLPKEGEFIITQHGKPKGVLLDINSYLDLEEFQEQIADSDPKLIAQLNAALDEAKAGKKIPAEKVFKDLGI